MKLMPVGLWLPAVSLGLVLGVGALAQFEGGGTVAR